MTTDWITIVVPIVTGIVGIAGTSLGALLTGRKNTANLKLSLSAEDMRAKRVEKRQIYASYLTAVNISIPALARDRAIRNSAAENADREAAFQNTTQARTALLNSTMELELIASPEVIEFARSVTGHLMDYWEKTGKGAKLGKGEEVSVGQALNKLRAAMRADIANAADEQVAFAPGEKPRRALDS